MEAKLCLKNGSKVKMFLLPRHVFDQNVFQARKRLI
jgi:hypothetical protein